MARRGRRNLLRRLGLWLAGLVAFAVLGTAGWVLPWRFVAPPTSAFMLREWIARGEAPRYRWLPLSQISPQLAIAVVAAEDQRFPVHHGFDFGAIERALEEGRHRPRGASTISQQVAKNLYLWPGRSLVRKACEAWLTLFIEVLWPKRRILEVYLNIAEFGRGVFGAGAASERYFGKPARQLTLGEAALLAAALPTPKKSSVVQPSAYLRRRAAAIEAAARGLGGSGYLARLSGMRTSTDRPRAAPSAAPGESLAREDRLEAAPSDAAPDEPEAGDDQLQAAPSDAAPDEPEAGDDQLQAAPSDAPGESLAREDQLEAAPSDAAPDEPEAGDDQLQAAPSDAPGEPQNEPRVSGDPS